MSRQNVKATATAMENASVENAFVKLASKAPFVKQNWSVPRLPTDENAAAMVNASMAIDLNQTFRQAYAAIGMIASQ